MEDPQTEALHPPMTITAAEVKGLQDSIRRIHNRIDKMDTRLDRVEVAQLDTAVAVGKLEGTVEASTVSVDRLYGLLVQDGETEAANIELRGKRTDGIVVAIRAFRDIALSRVGLIVAVAILAVALPAGGLTARQFLTAALDAPIGVTTPVEEAIEESDVPVVKEDLEEFGAFNEFPVSGEP